MRAILKVGKQTDILQTNKQAIEKKGRSGDKKFAHLTLGEIVIPRAFAEDDDFRATINQFFKENNVDLRKFIVGDSKNKVNPETGYMEFGFFKSILKPFKQISREMGRVYEKQIGKTGDIKYATDIIGRPGRVTEDVYKRGTGYKIGKEIGRIIPKMPDPPPLPPIPDPLPTPMMTEETQAAKARVRAKKMGRRRNILAGRYRGTGRMMESLQILNTRL
jgi:hypothetical protein